MISENDYEQIAFQFFSVFSRMEYALKKSGTYLKGDNKKAEPDWGKFALHINEKFQRRSDSISEAIMFYNQAPPKKQIVVDDVLSWSETLPSGRTDTETILLLVKRVRNNLFHGGKFNSRDHRYRDKTLLSHGLQILTICIDCSSDVREHFNSTDNYEDW